MSYRLSPIMELMLSSCSQGWNVAPSTRRRVVLRYLSAIEILGLVAFVRVTFRDVEGPESLVESKALEGVRCISGSCTDQPDIKALYRAVVRHDCFRGRPEIIPDHDIGRVRKVEPTHESSKE